MANDSGWHHLYQRAAWKRLRHAQLMLEPLCRFCLEAEDVTVATVVDHIEPHKGNEEMFFDPSNLQSLCKPHHDRTKQRMERGQRVVRYGADGWPI